MPRSSSCWHSPDAPKGPRVKPEPPYLTTGMRPSTAEEMVAVAVCSWPGVGTVAHVLGPADPLNAGAAAGFKVDLG